MHPVYLCTLCTYAMGIGGVIEEEYVLVLGGEGFPEAMAAVLHVHLFSPKHQQYREPLSPEHTSMKRKATNTSGYVELVG